MQMARSKGIVRLVGNHGDVIVGGGGQGFTGELSQVIEPWPCGGGHGH